jgi:hypothetical protein
MNPTKQSISANILIHTNDVLDESAIQHVFDKLNELNGVTEIRFIPNKNHLLMVSYTPNVVKASQLLTTVKKLGHKAQLVGL